MFPGSPPIRAGVVDEGLRRSEGSERSKFLGKDGIFSGKAAFTVRENRLVSDSHAQSPNMGLWTWVG
jgi:hypothetical protein